MKHDLPKNLKCPHPVADDLFVSRVQALIDESAPAVPPPSGLQSLSEPSPSASGYSHQAMVELIIAHPDWDHKRLAAHWCKNAGWFASVLASDAFQQELDKSRHLIPDPYITATLDERFRALTLLSLTVLQGKLDGKEVNDQTVLKATEIGVKALGMGQIAPPPTAPATVGVDALAERLVSALEKQRRNVRTIEAEVVPQPELKGN